MNNQNESKCSHADFVICPDCPQRTQNESWIVRLALFLNTESYSDKDLFIFIKSELNLAKQEERETFKKELKDRVENANSIQDIVDLLN